MQRNISVSREEIFHQVKLSGQIPNLIEGVVTRKIIESAAAEAGIKVEVEELQEAADTFRLVGQLHSTDDTWSWLKTNLLSLDDFEELIQINVLSQKLAEHLFEEQVESFFYENQLDYAGVVMYEVVLEDGDLAMELFYALSEGEVSFHEIARQYIQDLSLRRAGGYRGIMRRKDLRPEISSTVFAATPPQILKPIVTSKGKHLIWVEEIIQPQLDEELRDQILSDLFSEWLKQQIEQVKIAIPLPEEKKTEFVA